jgi:hypothetical protein
MFVLDPELTTTISLTNTDKEKLSTPPQMKIQAKLSDTKFISGRLGKLEVSASNVH